MIVVILPAYNEQEAILPLIESLRKTAGKRLLEEVKILVVDDGSSDETAARVRALAGEDLLLVPHGRNLGLGAAIRTGLLSALELGPEVSAVITMDADNTHTPGLIPHMLQALDAGNDLVIASRYRSGARVVGLSWQRELISLGMSWMFRLLLPIRGVRDYSCGYRAYRASLLREAFTTWGDDFVNQTGFSCMLDILLKLDRLGAICAEVPMILHYDYKHGGSKMKVGRTIAETLRLAARERAARWRRRQPRP